MFTLHPVFDRVGVIFQYGSRKKNDNIPLEFSHNVIINLTNIIIDIVIIWFSNPNKYDLNVTSQSIYTQKYYILMLGYK